MHPSSRPLLAAVGFLLTFVLSDALCDADDGSCAQLQDDRFEDPIGDVRLLQFEHHLKGNLAASAFAFEAAYQVQGRPFFEKAFTAVRNLAVQTWNQLTAAVRAAAEAIGRAVVSWAAAVVNFIKTAWNNAARFFKALGDGIVNISKMIGEGIVNLAKQAWDFFKQLWDCFDPMRFLCALFLKNCDCNAGSGLSINFNTGVLGVKCVGFAGFPMPHFTLGTESNMQWPIGQKDKGKPKMPGNEKRLSKQGPATNRSPKSPEDMAKSPEAMAMRAKAVAVPKEASASCSGSLSVGLSAGAELSPSFDLTVDLPKGAIVLKLDASAGVYADAFVTAQGSCTFTATRGFPAVPVQTVGCTPFGCIAVLLQIVLDFEATGVITGTIAAGAGADVTTGAEVSLNIADGKADCKATSPQFTTRSGLDVSGSLSAKVRVGLGPMVTIWPIPGLPITVYPQANVEVRAYGELELLSVGARAALQQELNATRLRRHQDRAALVQADGMVLNLAEYQDDEWELPPVGADAIQTACIAAGINIFIVLNVTGLGLPPGFAAALDTASLVTSMTSDMIDGAANMVKLPLQMTAKCLPGLSGIANALSSVVDKIASIAKDAIAGLASILPSISSFLDMLSNLTDLFTGRLWCKEITSWGAEACKSKIGCDAPDAPAPAPIMAAITTTANPGDQAPLTNGVTLGGQIAATDLWAQLDKDNTGHNVCGATKHVCNYQEISVLAVLGGIDTSTNVWITAGFSNWDNHRRGIWSGQDATQCVPGNYPVWWAKWGPYYGRVHCEGAGVLHPVGCCDDVPAGSDTSNMRTSGWAGTYNTLNSLLDQDNSGANVCGGGWHVCSFAEVTVYGATRGLSPSGWITGSFTNWEAHRRSLWNGQDSTFCPPGRFPFAYGQWYSYFGRAHCEDQGATKNAVCCRNLQSTTRPGVMTLTPNSVTYNTINSQLDGNWDGHAPCASVGPTWHICNYQETFAFMSTTGIDVGQPAWIVGGFSNWEAHRRSIFNGQDITLCPAGKYPMMFGKWSVYYGLVHCVAASDARPVLCCADDGFRNINQPPTTTTPTTAITTTTTKVHAACARPSGWCTHAGSVYSVAADCDGDRVADPFCFDTAGKTGFLSSLISCRDSWPSSSGDSGSSGLCKALCLAAFQQNPAESSRIYSSVWDNNLIGTGHARSTLDSPQAWSASIVQVGEWMQIDVGARLGVQGVVIQGRLDCDQWVKKFAVQYSLTGDSFVSVPGSFDGSTDRNTKVKAVFPSMVMARYVRILPTAWTNHMSMRAGVLTCQEALAGASQAPTTTTRTTAITTTTTKAALRPGMVVALRGGRSRLYCADEFFRIICNRGAMGGWERFTVLDAGGGRLALRGGRVNQLCADEVSRVTCNRRAVTSWESFTLQFQAGNIVSFKGGRAGQWCSDGPAGVTCDRSALGPWEQFTVECQSGC